MDHGSNNLISKNRKFSAMTPQSNSRTHNNCFSLGKLSNNKSNNRMLHNKIRIWKWVHPRTNPINNQHGKDNVVCWFAGTATRKGIVFRIVQNHKLYSSVTVVDVKVIR